MTMTETEKILTTTEASETNENCKIVTVTNKLRELDDGEYSEIQITNDLVKRIYQLKPECIKPILEDMKPLIIEVVSGARKNWRHNVVTGNRVMVVGGFQVRRHHLDHMSPCGNFGQNEIIYVQRVLVSLILEWLVIVMFELNAAQLRFYLKVGGSNGGKVVYNQLKQKAMKANRKEND